MESLPNEILVQILDDQGLRIPDLAALSRVSRRWHEAITPSLYRRYTFRYLPDLGGLEEKKLASFMKYRDHVKFMNLHIMRWKSLHELSQDGDVDTDSDLAKICNVLDAFPSLIGIEYYDVVGVGWTDFWIILNYLLTQKPKLVDLGVRRHLPYSVKSPTEHDLEGYLLYPTNPLPDLKSFRFRISCRSEHSFASFPHFLDCMTKSIGNTTQNVVELQIHLRLFAKREREQLVELCRELECRNIKFDKLRELNYELMEAPLPPLKLIEGDLSKIKALSIPSYVVHDWAIAISDEESSLIDLSIFTGLETLCILNSANLIFSEEIVTEWISDLARLLPRLESIVLDEDNSTWNIARWSDGTPGFDFTKLSTKR
ncbi:hypothetical protein ABW19_dt0204629 [Dactylella cylindrospora]|nr:hypothetical protein ABW19_dt0204629 [Dactylella cylindrospora]